MKTRDIQILKEGSIRAKRYFLNIRKTTRGEWYNKNEIVFAI